MSQWTFQDCTLIGRTENILLVAEYIDFGCKHVSQRTFLLGCPKAIFESGDAAQSMKHSLIKKSIKKINSHLSSCASKQYKTFIAATLINVYREQACTTL